MSMVQAGESSPKDGGTKSLCPVCSALYERSVLICERCGTSLLEIPDAPLLSGSVLDGRYDMGEVVGTGGMGTVYRATQRAMERHVAVKVLHPRFAYEPRAVKRFFREAQAASKLIHPNIVSIYDFGRSNEGHLYMVMELLEGATLGDLIHYRAPLPAALALSVCSQLCEGLAEAHTQRLVHRDLKPDNILLQQHEEALWVKVLDFGIAKLIRDPDEQRNLERAYSTIDIAGTPAYMSPEQILGRELDPRSDLYSLGIILYEMLTRERPFDDDNSVALCMKQLNERPPKLSTKQTISDKLERLVDTLLAKDPAQRPQSAREVRKLIDACPEATFPFSVPPLKTRGLSHLGERKTRLDAHILPDALTVIGTSALTAAVRQSNVSEGREVERKTLGLSAKELPDLLAAQAKRERPSFGRKASALDPNETVARGFRPGLAAIVCVLLEHDSSLGSGPLASLLESFEREGHDVLREDRRVIVRAYSPQPIEFTRTLAERLIALQSQALVRHEGLRLGLTLSGQDPMGAIDLASRLAAASTHGQVAMSMAQVRTLALPARPLTSIFMPDGQSLDMGVLRDAQKVTQMNAEPQPPMLWGRSMALRRLGQFGDEAMRQGGKVAIILGARYMGKSSLLQAFLLGKRALHIRCSPLGQEFPGYGLAQLLVAMDGVSLRGLPSDLDPISVLPLPEHTRELMELLVLDHAPLDAPSPRAFARLLSERLERFVGQEPLVLAIDDAHLLDAVTLNVLRQWLKLSERRPWSLVLTTRTLEGFESFDQNALVELRPLGLRAMHQLADELKIPPRVRHGYTAAANGHPGILRLLSEEVGGQEGVKVELPSNFHALGEGLLGYLLTQRLRSSDPRSADRAWVAASLGEGGPLESVQVQAARYFLEREPPREIATWLADRLKREGPLPALLARAIFKQHLIAERAELRARRCERLGFFEEAALEMEWAVRHSELYEQAPRVAYLAELRARSGDLQGARELFIQLAERGCDLPLLPLLKVVKNLLELGDEPRGAELLEQIGDISTSCRDAKVLTQWWILRARLSLLRGDMVSVQEALGQAREVNETLLRTDARGARTHMAFIQEMRAELCLMEGDKDGARTNLRQARDAFRDLEQTADALRCLIALGEVERLSDDLRRAQETFRTASRLAGRAGLIREELLAELGLGETELALDELDEGAQRIRQAFRRANAESDDLALGARAALAMTQTMLVRKLFVDAARYLERARQLSSQPSFAARACLLEAESLMGQNQLRRAWRHWEQAERLARSVSDALVLEQVKRLRATLSDLGGPEGRRPYSTGRNLAQQSDEQDEASQSSDDASLTDSV